MTQASVVEHINTAIALCRETLATPKYAAITDALPESPSSARDWFELLQGYPVNSHNIDTIKRLKSAWPKQSIEAGGSFEHYAVLQALTVSAEYVLSKSVANSVKRLYAELCVDVAESARHLRRHFNEGLIDRDHFVFSDDGRRFHELSWLATLQRYPAGDFVFDIHPYLSRSIALKIPPLALPGFLREITFGMEGWGPMLSPHVHSGRPNQLVLHREGFERALYRMAKTVEIRPDMKGLITSSWLHSAQTAELTPHLSWMRTVFLDANAYLVDMETTVEDDAFKIGSSKRRRLNEQGEFYPRDTLVLWRRADMLAWAAGRPELRDPVDEPVKTRRETGAKFRISVPKPVRSGKHNGPITLWDGRFLLKYKPKQYIWRVMLLPCLAAASAASVGVAWWAGALAFAVTFIFVWLLQYYFFQ